MIKCLAVVFSALIAVGPVWAGDPPKAKTQRIKVDPVMQHAKAIASNLDALDTYFPEDAPGKNSKLDPLEARLKQIQEDASLKRRWKIRMLKRFERSTGRDVRLAQRNHLDKINFDKTLAASRDHDSILKKGWRTTKHAAAWPFKQVGSVLKGIGKFFSAVGRGIHGKSSDAQAVNQSSAAAGASPANAAAASTTP